MSAISTKLVQGPARLFVAATSAALPGSGDYDELELGTFAGWTEVGHTTSAVTLTDTPTLVEANSQQSSRVVAVAVSKWDTQIETTVREITMQNISRALHGAIAGQDVNPAATTAAQVAHYAIVGPWSAGDKCLIVVEFGVISSGLKVSFDRENYMDIPMTIKVLDGTTLPAGYKVTIIDLV